MYLIEQAIGIKYVATRGHLLIDYFIRHFYFLSTETDISYTFNSFKL